MRALLAERIAYLFYLTVVVFSTQHSKLRHARVACTAALSPSACAAARAGLAWRKAAFWYTFALPTQTQQADPFAETIEIPINTEQSKKDKISKPDLIIYESSILQSNKILITLGNIGDSSLLNQAFGIKLSKISGEIIGIIEFGPDDIIKNKYTTFIVPIELVESGLHIIHIDYLNEIDEINEENNTTSQVYVINQKDNLPN